VKSEHVGLVSGLAEGLFMLAECCTAPLAARWSDRFGRVPLLLGGLFCFAMAGVVYGLSSSVFWILVLRCLQGASCGAGGVVSRTILVEITDKTNIVPGM
jgi:MFS family permease